MQEEEEEQPSFFRGSIAETEVQLFYYPHYRSYLEIRLTYIAKYQRFTTKVYQFYIKKRPEFTMIQVKSTLDLFYYMIENIHKITVSPLGSIQLHIPIKESVDKAKAIKAIEIFCKKIKMKDFDLMQLEYGKMQKKELEIITKNCQRVKTLEESNKLLQKQIVATRAKEKETRQASIKNQKDYVQIIEKAISSFKRVNQVEKEPPKQGEDNALKKALQSVLNKPALSILKKTEIKIQSEAEYQKQLLAINNSIKQYTTVHNSLNEQVQKLKNYQNELAVKLQFEKRIGTLKMNTENPHHASFKMTRNDTSFHVMKVDNDTKWVNYINCQPFPIGKISIIKMTALQSRNRKIQMSIGSKNAFGQQLAHKCHKDIMGLMLHDGYCNIRTKVLIKDRQIAVGECVQMTVNLIDWTVQWSVQKDLVYSFDIPDDLKMQPLFLFVHMCHRNDQVRIWC